MATLVLQTAGQALGGLFGPLGGIIGRAAGAIAGNVIDQTLFGPPTRHSEGPRLSDLYVQASTEGAPVPRVWGRMRIAGQIIWATRLEEVVSTSSTGGKGALSRPSSTVTDYEYFANLAIGLAQGPIARIGRVWADGKEIELDAFTWRFYPGDEAQEPDSLILAKEGADAAPAYRGLSYVVLERLPLAQFGNRVPQFSFEIFHPLESIEDRLRGVCIIPGSTEFGYEPQIVTRNAGWGETESENAHASALKSDWTVSLDQLTGICPNVSAASLVVAWFGERFALRRDQSQAWRGDGRQADRAAELERGRCDARQCLCGLAIGRRSRLRRHPERPVGHRCHRRSQGARPRRGVLPVHPDGHRARQRPSRSLWWSRAGRLSLARAHHLRPCAGRNRLAR